MRPPRIIRAADRHPVAALFGLRALLIVALEALRSSPLLLAGDDGAQRVTLYGQFSGSA